MDEQAAGQAVLHHAIDVATWAEGTAAEFETMAARCRAGQTLDPATSAVLLEKLAEGLRRSGEQHLLVGVLTAKAWAPGSEKSMPRVGLLLRLVLWWLRRRGP
jgi:hypothetical protein